MIETEQRVLVAAPIGDVWTHVSDIGRWAAMMPGYRDCALIDDMESRWTLKVGVGGLLRTVTVRVHVDRWGGPEEVDFSYALEGDPVTGGGTYRALPVGPARTEIALTVRVVGGGPMAPMWEAMGRPLLPKFAASFGQRLAAEIEARLAADAAGEAADGASAAPDRPFGD